MTEQASRVRVERLAIVESRFPAKLIRDVRLHAGLNIVWAEELPAADGASEVERAGHGVGKTTFSLMLRAVLGDDGVAVRTMRSHLADYYGSGGIAAEVLAGDDRYAVFRSFGSKSFAFKNGTVECLLEESARTEALDFSGYVTALGENACLRHMGARALPVTAQAVEWSHVLCWVARDQGLGLRQYFEWRNEGGAGLRRKVKDPPTLVRLVLGLLSNEEAAAEERISNLNGEITRARDTLRREEQRGTNTRGIVETQLRTWAGVSSALRMVADDLFADSVEKEIERKVRQLEAKNDDARAEVVALDQEIVELAADSRVRDRTVQLAKARWEETVALRKQDDESLKEIRERRDKLLTLSGTCQYGAVSYAECSYVQAQRDTIGLSARRGISVLSKTLEEQGVREAAEKAEYEREAKELAQLIAAQESRRKRRTELTTGIEARLRELGGSDAVRRTLTQWQESHLGPETEKLRDARAAVVNLERELEAAKSTNYALQQRMSERERQVSDRVAKLAKTFGVDGRYVPSDERRPFQMLGADGDAYTVLEILLGDLACAADGAAGGGAHPGVLILDCPREREMGAHLYERFLGLVSEVCTDAPGLQVVLTTTTPPPPGLREPPTCVLKLSRGSDADLLLKRRIENLLARVPPPAKSTGDEDER